MAAVKFELVFDLPTPDLPPAPEELLLPTPYLFILFFLLILGWGVVASAIVRPRPPATSIAATAGILMMAVAAAATMQAPAKFRSVEIIDPECFLQQCLADGFSLYQQFFADGFSLHQLIHGPSNADVVVFFLLLILCSCLLVKSAVAGAERPDVALAAARRALVMVAFAAAILVLPEFSPGYYLLAVFVLFVQDPAFLLFF